MATAQKSAAKAKRAPATTPAKADPNGYQIKAEEWGFTKGDTDSQMLASLSTRSAMTATTYKAFANCGDKLEVSDLVGELRKAGEEVASGNLSRVEKMLAHQALTLDAIFNNMAQRSHRQETFKGIEVLMRLALKAQAQARSTAEALALLKNPQPYIRQANMTTGPQQVNNGNAAGFRDQYAQARTGAGNIQSEPNKLLETDHVSRMDIGAHTKTVRTNSRM
jgi:hypothetical protein